MSLFGSLQSELSNFEVRVRLEQLEKQSHPPVDWIGELKKAIKDRKEPLYSELKQLIKDVIAEDKYDSSPDRWED